MSIEFRRAAMEARVLDPRKEFAETICPFEVRFDPLLGDQCRILGYRYTWRPTRSDVSDLVARSLKTGCPFCPENLDHRAARFVPDLVPEGRLRIGEATVVPNLSPYNKYGAVTVISRAHFLGLKQFTPRMLSDAFAVSLSYVRRIAGCDLDARYNAISWNYMPQSGAGQLHPHLQVQPDTVPFTYERRLYQACQEYQRNNGSGFFADLVKAEKEAGERFIVDTGRIAWLTPFSPRSMMPGVLAVVRECSSLLDLADEDVRDLSRGVCRVLRYFDDQAYPAFNLGVVSGLAGETHTWTSVHMLPRMPLPPFDASDHHQMSAIHGEVWAAQAPEQTCADMKCYFEGPE